MKYLLLPTLTVTLSLCAQDKPNPWANPDNLKGAMYYLHDQLYTLKKPTKYSLPKPIQNMIMVALNEVNPSRALVLREEYEVIYQSKDDLRTWVDGLMVELRQVAKARKDLDQDDLEQQVDIEISADGWRYYNDTKW